MAVVVTQPPSSSTLGTYTAQNTATTDDSDKTIGSGSLAEKDLLKVAEDGSENNSNNRSLLHVPSRSSSHKLQPSPTATGLSGVTASDPRESIGGRSKESKGSILGRRRNGSASTSKMSITPPGPSADQPANAPVSAKSTGATKKKSFLSKLCCGVPDHADGGDANEGALPATKVTKVGQRPTTSSKPENPTAQIAPVGQAQSEKDALKQTDASYNQDQSKDSGLLPSATTAFSGANGELSRPGERRDQALPNPPKDGGSNATQAGHSSPAVLVQTPPVTPDPVVVPQVSVKDSEGDTKMENSESVPSAKEETLPTPRKEEAPKPALPPPPPVPQSGPSEEERAIESVDGKQQWLLPPIAPRFKGKKCLVLDLDETLVHSSFKVISLQVHYFPICLQLLDFTPSRLHNSG